MGQRLCREPDQCSVGGRKRLKISGERCWKQAEGRKAENGNRGEKTSDVWRLKQ